jgi:hypothetical protein
VSSSVTVGVDCNNPDDMHFIADKLDDMNRWAEAIAISDQMVNGCGVPACAGNDSYHSYHPRPPDDMNFRAKTAKSTTPLWSWT